MKKPNSLSQFALIALAFAGLAPQAHAVSEADYANLMQTEVKPFYATGVDGSFRGKDGLNIRYRKWENPKETGAIVVLTGRGDPFLTFAETIYELAQKGYSIYAMDHRGQGSSDRILPNPELGYVRHFEDYVIDAKIFVDTVVNEKPHQKRFILAHSMGGAIAAEYCLQFPGDFTAIALVAPMLQIDTHPYAHWAARALAWFNVLIGKATEYAPTQHDFDVNAQFEGNKFSGSQVRWQNLQDTISESPLTLGGATNQWVKESLKVGLKIHKQADQFETPTLMLTAGLDSIVEPAEEEYFCLHAKRCSQIPVYKDSQHNILAERDSIRDDAMSQIIQFFSEY